MIHFVYVAEFLAFVAGLAVLLRLHLRAAGAISDAIRVRCEVIGFIGAAGDLAEANRRYVWTMGIAGVKASCPRNFWNKPGDPYAVIIGDYRAAFFEWLAEGKLAKLDAAEASAPPPQNDQAELLNFRGWAK